MTDDLSIDRALALAIGWREEDVEISNGSVLTRLTFEGLDIWWEFKHLAFDVIWPIAERFDCFPGKLPTKPRSDPQWFAWCILDSGNDGYVEHPNPATAVALAVIAAALREQK